VWGLFAIINTGSEKVPEVYLDVEEPELSQRIIDFKQKTQ